MKNSLHETFIWSQEHPWKFWFWRRFVAVQRLFDRMWNGRSWHNESNKDFKKRMAINLDDDSDVPLLRQLRKPPRD